MSTMQAVRQVAFGAPDVLTLDELPLPQPQPEEVLIRVHAASINHFDILSRRGDFPDIPLPRIVGMDCSGYVEEYSGTRTDLVVGQPIVVLGTTLGNGGPGGYATYVCINQSEVFPVPHGFDLTAATCLGMTYLTAWYALVERAGIEADQQLLIPGVGGGVASAALQIATALGIHVIATTSSSSKRQQAIALGAEACFNYRQQDVVQALQEWTQGKGADVVLDAVGGDTIQQGLDCLSKRGALVSIGIVRGTQFCVDAIKFLSNEQVLMGVNAGQLAPTKRYEIFLKLVDLIQAGKLEVLVSRTFPLAQAAEAHRFVESNEQFGKVVLLAAEK
ncbi:MAG: zinc-binding alcohol dehydrogenase family protein [Leptolyngbya sp. BL-A-14]